MKKGLQPAISWKWTALKEFNSLATKSLSVLFKSKITQCVFCQIFPVSAKIKLICRLTHPPSTLAVKIPNFPKVGYYNIK